MAQQKPSAEPIDFFLKIEHFLEDNKKAVTAVLVVFILGSAAFLGVTKFYLPGQEKEAQAQMFQAQMYFEKDSFNLALNGDGNYLGFQDIADEFGWTKAANLSNYYAGICHLRMGDFQEAIDYLKKFDADDKIVSSMALGAIGDAYSELNDMEKAISYYQKAARNNNNDLTTPMFLFKAGLALQVQGKNEEALKLFNEVKNDYPKSAEAANIDKYIAMVE